MNYELNSFLNRELDFNDLLLRFFSQTEQLIILESEVSYIPKTDIKLAKKEKETYYH